MLDQVIVRAFLASTGQRLVRWSTGDGYHVMFMDHWGARLYRDVLVFACRLLSLWTRAWPARRMPGDRRCACPSDRTVP
jgi:hypothetical protein